MEIKKTSDITPELVDKIKSLPDILRLSILTQALCLIEIERLEKKKRALLTMKWMMNEKKR